MTTSFANETEEEIETQVRAKVKPSNKHKNKDSENKPKQLPPYAVIVHNDEDHTFAYVIDSFMKVFGYTMEKCYELATAIHVQGQAIVWSGSKEVAELKKDQIISCGPDLYAAKKVETPLSVSIEPMP